MALELDHDFTSKWEHIVSEVNKTEIPAECLKKVIIRLAGKKQRTINLHSLVRQGLELAEIEELVARTLDQLDDQIRDVEFVIDINAVAALVQPQTDKLLGKL